MALSANDIKCALSEAYAHAIVSAAGYSCQNPTRTADNMGIDAVVKVAGVFGPPGALKRFSANIQLKATTAEMRFDKGGRWKFYLDVKTYNDFRMAPPETGDLQLLIILALPPRTTPDRWLLCKPNQLAIMGRAHWVSRCGAPATDNASSVPVTVRKANRVTVDALQEIARKFACRDMVVYES